jgi:RHS repeat-associated protein
MSFAGFALLALVAFGMAAPSPARRSGPGGLEGRWKLDEGSGTSAADVSGNANTGTLNNGVAWVSGKSGSALSLDGVDDYVSCGVTGMPAANASQTISWWMNYASVPSGVGTAIDLHNDASGSGIQTGFRSGQVTVWKHGGGTLAQAAAPSTNTWHHFAYTFDATTHKLYMDGIQANSSTAAPQTAVPTTLVFGRWNGGTAEYYAGKLDEVRIYSRTLSASEVALLAHDAALEAYWKLDEGTGTSTADSTANQYNGTLTNGPTWVAGQVGQAVRLEGTNDYIALGSNLNILRNVPAATLTAWIKINTLPGSGASMELVSFSKNAGGPTSSSRARIKLIGTGTAANLIGGGRSTDSENLLDVQATGTALAASTWYHVAGVIDYTGKTVKLYVNGSQAASGTTSFASNTTPDTASSSAALGAEEDGSAGFFNGMLDEVRVYSRALSADEIAGLAGGTGTGLAAVYYDNMDWTGTFIQRTDATINFNWGTGSPDAAIGADTFSAVWTGQVQPQYSETYTFYTNTDDGVRLWVNGQLLVDFPQDQAPTERSGQITLSGGVKYNLRMEYFENGGGAVAELRWSSGSTPKAIIPQSQLYPTDTTAPQILAATAASADLTKVYVRFSEAMDKTTAETTGYWTLSGGLTVSSAALSSDKRVVTLTASGNVTQGTTTVTASSSILGITREALAAPYTLTIVAGNSQGIADSTAITLIMTTDGNLSTVMFNEPSSHGVPQGVGEIFRVEAPGTSATTVTLRQMKKTGGKGQLNFLETGDNSSTTVTTSGGSPNVAFAVVRHLATSAFAADLVVEAVVSGEVRGTKDVTVVELSFSTKYAYIADQTPFTVTAQVTPALQNLELTNRTYLLDFGKTDGTKETTLLKMPAWSLTNGSGQATRTYTPKGVTSFLYDAIQLKRPMIALFNTAEGSMYCNKDWECSWCGGHASGTYSVKLTDGEKKLTYQDLTIKGRGFDYTFGRMYRSSIFQKALAATGAPVVQDFGVGWSYSYADDYLIKDGTGSEDSSNMITWRSGQEANVFINVGTAQWSSGRSEFTQLRKNAAGDFEIRDKGGMISTFTNFQTGTTPNKNGRLKSLEDRNGNRMTFFYEQIDPDNTVSGDEKYVLAYAVDTLGREIRYQYFAKTAQTIGGRPVTITTTNAAAYGRLAAVKDFKGNMNFDGTNEPDFSGQDCNRQLQFGYDSEGNLTKARTPIVAGTPNGNDFPSGKATRYRYYTSSQHPGFTQTQWDALTQAQKNRLLGKLTHIWYPNEVKDQVDTDPADADAAETIGYETNTASRFYGYATSYAVGGTNGNGVPSGGSYIYAYTDLNTGHGVGGHPYNFFQVQSLKTLATDRNGNQVEYVFSAEKTLISKKELTKGLRAGEPANFETDQVWNGTGNLRMDRLETQQTNPEGDIVNSTYNDATSDRFQQGNKVRKVVAPGARGGDQTAIENVVIFEPIYNQPWITVSARGANSSASGFTPPIADPASRTITDPYDATKTLNLRYAVVNYYDYQESTLASTAWSATSSFTPTTVDSQTVKATEVLLLRKLGLPDGNDTDRTSSIRELRNRLSANLVKLGLGDLNGDGNTDPVASGNVIRTAYGSPVLLANTNQHKLEGNIETAGDLIDQTKNVVDGGTQEGSNGARLQTIVWSYQFNGFGQMTKSISPEGNVTAYAYFAENDPDGDTIATPSPADGRTLDTTAGSAGGGYLRDATRDTTRSYYQQTTGTLLSGGFSNNNTNPATTDIKVSYTYDDVGNVVTMTNGRSIRTDYFVNELNQVVQNTRAADVSAAASASPSDPLYNHSDTQQKLTAFAYKTRSFFDYNNQVVLGQVEDRGNTSSVDGSGLGSLPSQATGTTPGLSSADASGGDAYADTLTLYDRLNDSIETRVEVDSTRALVTRTRYDGNQRQVLVIHPEGNADSQIYDERNLLFQMTRGASSRPSAGKYASGDPTTFDRPGGSGTTPSTLTYNYDKDKNLVETVDAADTDGDSSNNSTIAGSGDVMARVTYDGYNRRKTVTDPLGNKTTYLYDPDSNAVRVIHDGDPVDDVVGSSENKTLSVTETIYDELSRTVCIHQVLFQTPDASPSRTPLLTDTPAMDSLAAYLSDASSDTASVPGATGITVIGRVTWVAEYDREGRGTFRIQDDLDVSRMDYDGVGRVVRTTDDALSNGFSSGAYDPAAISGNTVERAYDDNGNAIEVKETDVTAVANVAAKVFRTTLIYDSLDRLQTSFDNLGLTRDLRHDSRGNRAASADAVGPVSSRSFNRRGLGSTAAVTLNNCGNVTRSTYDGASRLLETEVRLTSSGQGDGTNIGATLEGVKTTAPTVDTAQSGDGLISVYYAYDDNSQLLALRDDDGNTTAYIYDNQNRMKVERKGLAFTGTTFSISGGDSGSFNVALRGGVTPVDTEANGTDLTLTYDADSNVATRVDEAGNSFACTYDALNRRKSCTITPASGFVGTTSQTWKYDGLSRLTECFDNNGSGTTDDVTDKHFYDSLSRAVEESQQIGSLSVRAISYSYELDCACGNPSTGLPSEATYPDGRRVHSEWDRLDRLIERHDVEGTTEYSAIGTYQYIGKSRVAVLTYQNNIRLTHIGQVSSQNADTGFDGLRRIVNHRWESFTTQALGAGTLVMGFEHQDGNGTPGSMYDRASNKRIEYKTHDPGNSEQYKYDSAYRLTSTGSGSQGTDARAFERGTFTNANRTSMSGGIAFYQDWDLEGVGNWTRQDDNARIETRNHSDFNEINQRTVSGNNSTLTYDKNGNATDTGYSTLGGQSFPGGGLRMEWDALNRLKKVYQNTNTPGSTGDDVLVAEYVYDAQNRRMRKVVTNSGGLNGTTDFYYDGWRVVEERDGSDAVTNQYTYGNYLDEVWTLDNRRSSGTVASLNDNSGTNRHFYLSNTLYHVYGLTNEGSSTTPGTLKEAYQYDAYGKQTVITDGNDSDAIVNFNSNDVRTVGGASSINGSPYMYTGQRFDSEGGLVYYKRRYLSTDVGRFISRDTIEETEASSYAYVANRPTSRSDPSGAKSCTSGKCCCCADGLEFQDLGFFPGKKNMSVGHHFQVHYYYHQEKWDKDYDGDCELKWCENANLPYQGNKTPLKWVDMTKSLPGGTPGWDNRTKKCPSDGIDYAFDDDYPHVNNDAPKDPFKVAIRIIMYSTPDCTACKEKFQLLQLFVSIDPASRKTSVDPFNSPWKPPGAGAVLPCE